MENHRRPSMIVHIPVSLGPNGERIVTENSNGDHYRRTPPKRSSFSVAGLLNEVEDDIKPSIIDDKSSNDDITHNSSTFSIIDHSDTFAHPDDIKIGTPRVKSKRSSLSSKSTPKTKGKGKTSGSTGKPGRKSSTSSHSLADGTTSTPTTTASGGTKRTYNRTYQTLLIATKVRHLKKGDGEPLWRVDIQYDFLSSVFNNSLAVFGNSYVGTKGHTFADIYIDAMARSSKCSKVLREKLLGDKKAGLNMAMVCLLVNVGRMNTTLNFFPEMKAQLRTYHPIPSLQSRSNQSDYKQLQDAPRLKSILKGACEDRPEPGTLEDLMAEERSPPRTNPINLLFLLSTYATKVEETFFTDHFEFFDLIMNKELSSESRARAFLWLVYAYLETGLQPDELRSNPFGFGQQDGVKVPFLRRLSPEEVELENVDPISEKEFGAEMTRVRAEYLIQTNQVAVDVNESGEIYPNGTPIDSMTDNPVSRETPIRPSIGRGSRRHTLDSNTPSGGLKKRKLAGTPTKRTLRTRAAHNYKEVGEEEDAENNIDKLLPQQPSMHKNKVKLTVKLTKRSKEEEERELRCNSRIKQMLKEKYERRRRFRHSQGAIRRTWSRIKDIDPLYDSDDDLVTLQQEEPILIASATSNQLPLADVTTGRSKRRSRKSSIAIPTVPAGLDEFPGDYGEEQTAIARALRRTTRWLQSEKEPHQIPSTVNGQINGSQSQPTLNLPLQPSPPRPHGSDVMEVHNLLQEVAS